MREASNLRFELRAYTEPDPCRLASILLETGSPASRDAVADRWAEHYPRHATQTGDRSIRKRITKSLAVMKAAGIAQSVETTTIVVLNAGLLHMAVRNLEIVEDSEGIAVRPGLWSRRPEMPAYLCRCRSIWNSESLKVIHKN
ncbi:MAG TPA: hypothetical protein VFT59_01665 [Candidatus Saccharimonadales bacterium]|nr:hypothetical protein [Candidatus Saccharimonadales bacterium]